ncbi:MAG: ACP S-malonyltransferase [Dehalococcoidia bacterium]|nr:ACP S-malonyltransferase [Dehalococcoidia bacterium]
MMAHPLKVVFVFSGHGSQFVGMGRDVYESFPEARAVFDEADATLGFSISKLCFEGPAEELCLPANVQPALLTLSVALLSVMRTSPNYVCPSYVAGHSLGEYAALAASGALGAQDAIMLARRRGQLMSQTGIRKPGIAAVIIGLTDEIVTAIASEAGVYVANFNYPGQVVISGETDRVENAISLAAAHGAIKAIPLAGSVAFHSPLMRSAADALVQVITKVHFDEPEFPVIGNYSASPLTSSKALMDELPKQLCHPVQWSKSMSYLLSQGADLFVEIGPGNVLSNIIRRIDKRAQCINIGNAGTLKEYMHNGFNL